MLVTNTQFSHQSGTPCGNQVKGGNVSGCEWSPLASRLSRMSHGVCVYWWLISMLLERLRVGAFVVVGGLVQQQLTHFSLAALYCPAAGCNAECCAETQMLGCPCLLTGVSQLGWQGCAWEPAFCECAHWSKHAVRLCWAHSMRV